MQDCRRYVRFEIHPSQRVVLVEGEPVDIKARAFDLLLVLEENRHRVVSKNELLDLVWAGIVVEENNLAVHVSALRKALGADVIATIPGRGYRFTAMPLQAEPPPPVPVLARPLRKELPPAGQFVGRENDLAALQALWARTRCVSIVGAGGIGKTTLALVAGRERQDVLPDGAAWVPLAELADAALVPGAVAQALGVETANAADPLPALVNALATQQLLLVIDNAEHVLEPVARLVRAVLAGAPRVAVLVTTQAPLKLEGEHVFRLGPLAVPAEDGVSAGQAMEHGAVALFAAQAQAQDRGFAVTDDNVDTVVALCRHLDGVPLALKLAAARLPTFHLRGLVTRLGDRLRLLRHGDRDAPARQQTLLAALDWSHGLLGDVPKVVFRRLAVFSGGFPLDMVAGVAGDASVDEVAAIDALEELVDRSLVSVDAGDPPRYRLLETTREYARLRLDEAGEAAATQSRHAQAVAAWMDDAYHTYWLQADAPWLAMHAPELDNVRAALEEAAGAPAALRMGLIGSAGVLFMLLGQAPEARRRFTALDAAARAAPASAASARYWLERSRLQWGIANDRMLEFAHIAVAHYRAIGDSQGVALALRCAMGSETLPPAEAEAALAEMTSLEPPDAPPRMRAQRLFAEASVLRSTGRMAEACAVWEALLALTTHAGLDGMASAALAGLSRALLATGNAEEALACARRLAADPRARHGNFVLHPLGTMAEAHLMQGHLGPARQAIEAFMSASRTRDWEWFGVYAGVFALLAAAEGRVDDAACLLGYADRAALQTHFRDEATTARSRAQAVIEKVMDAAKLARRRAEGERLDEASVCALALGVQRPR